MVLTKIFRLVAECYIAFHFMSIAPVLSMVYFLCLGIDLALILIAICFEVQKDKK